MLPRLWPALRCRHLDRAPLRRGHGRRRLSATTAPAPDRVVRSPYGDVAVPEVTIPEHIWRKLHKWDKHVFVQCGESGRRVTYGQARDASVRLASSLSGRVAREQGLERGAVVAIVLPNAPEYPIALLGAMEAGLVVTTVNPAFTPWEISKQLVDADAALVFTDVRHYAAVSTAVKEAARAKGRRPVPIVCVRNSVEGPGPLPEGAVDFDELVAESVDVAGFQRSADLTSRDVALLPYSSGTTGVPKGVMLSHRNIVSNLCQLHHDKVMESLETEGDFQEVYPAVLPFFHIYGVSSILMNLMCTGAKLITLPKFEATTYVKTLAENKCTALYVAPPLLLFLANNDTVTQEMLAPLRAIFCGAAPIGGEDIERLRTKSKTDLFVRQGYGLTETSPVVARGRKEPPKPASIGPPMPSTEVYVRDIVNGETLGPHQRGELCIRGPQVMIGYLNNQEATAETIDSNGFLRSGDIGYYDEDGDFYIADRLKELIKVKGFQVPPAELEELLRSHPSVEDAAVVGVPDGRAGELPRAYIVPKPNGPKPRAEDIAAFVAAKVVDYKQLRGGVRFIDVIPKNPSGKILRRKIKEMI